MQPIMKFRDIAARITGVSTPVFGVSWEAPPNERTIVRGVLVFIEDRRAFYDNHCVEADHEVFDSVQLVRTEVTRALQQLPEDSKAVPHLQSMRTAIRSYLDAVGPRQERFGEYMHRYELSLLRRAIGTNIGFLAVLYGIDVERQLAAIIPSSLALAPE